KPALADPNPRIRQAGLIALDQMKTGALQREQVASLLDTDDGDLQQATLEVMGRHPGWSGEAVGLLRDWLARDRVTAAQQTSLTGSLLAFSGDAKVQRLVAAALENPKTSVAMRLLVLRALARCRAELPKSWLAALGQALGHDDLAVRREAVAAIKARNLG